MVQQANDCSFWHRFLEIHSSTISQEEQTRSLKNHNTPLFQIGQSYYPSKPPWPSLLTFSILQTLPPASLAFISPLCPLSSAFCALDLPLPIQLPLLQGQQPPETKRFMAELDLKAQATACRDQQTDGGCSPSTNTDQESYTSRDSCGLPFHPLEEKFGDRRKACCVLHHCFCFLLFCLAVSWKK